MLGAQHSSAGGRAAAREKQHMRIRNEGRAYLLDLIDLQERTKETGREIENSVKIAGTPEQFCDDPKYEQTLYYRKTKIMD